MENEEFNEDFDKLPLESQMKLIKTKKNLEQMVAHLDEMGEQSRTFDAVLECAENIEDRKLLTSILFQFAEHFEQQKPIIDGDDFPQERAREIDWLRHVLKDKPQCMKHAVKALRETMMGDFDEALQVFNNVDCHDDEFSAIVGYWKEALIQ